jgi:hypothetical protein
VTEQTVVHEEDHSGADSRYDRAIEIESGHAPHSEEVEEPTTNNCSADPKKNVQDDALSGPIDDFAGNEASYKPKDDPRDN